MAFNERRSNVHVNSGHHPPRMVISPNDEHNDNTENFVAAVGSQDPHNGRKQQNKNNGHNREDNWHLHKVSVLCVRSVAAFFQTRDGYQARSPYTDQVTTPCSALWLDIAVAQVSLECPRIVTLVGQREAARVPQHVRMCLKPSLASMPPALHYASKACRGEGRAPAPT